MPPSAYINFCPHDVQVCKDSGYVYPMSPTTVLHLPFVCSWPSSPKKGQLSWLKTYTSSFYSSEGAAIKQTSDTNFIFTGAKQVGSNVDWDIMTGKLSYNGQPLWAKQLDNPSNQMAPAPICISFKVTTCFLPTQDFQAFSAFPIRALSITRCSSMATPHTATVSTPTSTFLVWRISITSSFQEASTTHLLTGSWKPTPVVMSTGKTFYNFTSCTSTPFKMPTKPSPLSATEDRLWYKIKPPLLVKANYQITKANSLGNSPNA